MTNDDDAKRPTVYFDGACPLCRREIAFYRRKRGAEAVAWVDVANGTPTLPDGLSPAAAKSRFHVATETGELKSGGDAFAYLWTRFPAFRWAGRIASTAPAVWLLERLYRLFLRFRPRLQRLFA